MSGATYDVAGDNEVEDKTIYMINDYGQFEAINRDLSGLENEEPQESQTELEAVIHHIQDVTQQLAIDDLKRPWLPPLPEAVYQEDLIETDFTKLWSDQPSEVVLTVGLKDVPEEQYQGPLELELKKQGILRLLEVLVMDAPISYTILFSILLTLSTRSTHMYLFDFGTNGLMPVSDVPHVADYFTVDQEDKIAKSIKRINQLISDRKSY